MASNTSSMFNDGPAEAAAPASTNVEVKVSAPPPTSTVASTVTSTSVEACAAVPVTPSTATATDPMKQLAPRMEPALDDHAAPAKDASLPSMRFSRVGGVGLEEMKTTLTFRKSCLKRSTSVAAATVVVPQELKTAAAPPPPAQKNRRRCWECRAKVPLTAVTCRCGYTFCNKHRYAEEHNCRFNFKQAAKRKLEEENPRCVPAKVARIN